MGSSLAHRNIQARSDLSFEEVCPRVVIGSAMQLVGVDHDAFDDTVGIDPERKGGSEPESKRSGMSFSSGHSLATLDRSSCPTDLVES